jgi:5-methylcytosine-specific restriction endonuclease McrA
VTREQTIERQRAWRAANKAKVAEYDRKRREAETPEQRAARLAAHRAYYRANREQSLARNRRWVEAHRDVVRKRMGAYVKRFLAKHPERVLENAARYRARKRGTSEGRVSYKRILAASGYCCGICKKPLDLLGTHFDHIVPLSKGGAHVEINIQPAHAVCNLRKSDKLLEMAS